jgi:hypothetical protein
MDLTPLLRAERLAKTAQSAADEARDDHGRWSATGGVSTHTIVPQGGVRQPAHDEADLYKLAEVGQGELAEALNRGSGAGSAMGFRTEERGPDKVTPEDYAKPGPILFLAPIKSKARAEEKVRADYKGDWSRLGDVVRATLAVDSARELNPVLRKLHDAGLSIFNLKDRTTDPTEMGYRNLKLSVRLPCGLVGEIQITPKPMLVANLAGHHWYEEPRSLTAHHTDDGITKPVSEWPEVDRSRYEYLVGKQNILYGDAWERSVRAEPTSRVI